MQVVASDPAWEELGGSLSECMPDIPMELPGRAGNVYRLHCPILDGRLRSGEMNRLLSC